MRSRLCLASFLALIGVVAACETTPSKPSENSEPDQALSSGAETWVDPEDPTVERLVPPSPFPPARPATKATKPDRIFAPEKPTMQMVSAAVGIRWLYQDADLIQGIIPRLFVFAYQDGVLIALSLAPDKDTFSARWSERPFLFNFDPAKPVALRLLSISWNDQSSPSRLFGLGQSYLTEAPEADAKALADYKRAVAKAQAVETPPGQRKPPQPQPPPKLGPFILSPTRVEKGLLPRLSSGLSILSSILIEPDELASGIFKRGSRRGRWELALSRVPGAGPDRPQPDEVFNILEIGSASIPGRTKLEAKWDTSFFGVGEPDPYVVVAVEEDWGDGEVAHYERALLETKDDTLSPRWDESIEFLRPAGSDLIFYLIDEDLASDDFVGQFRLKTKERGSHEATLEKGLGGLSITILN